jgi:LDH2 family malate/lactate/ureidoglycolate dehydrogenase
MAGYPGTEREKRVALAVLDRFLVQVFLNCGMRIEDARIVAGSLVAADVRGVHSHGALRTPEYVEKLLHRGVDPRGLPRLVNDSTAALVIDGVNCMGQVAASFAMRAAIDRARETQVAAAAVRGSNHCGAMFYYAMQGLEAGMIGIAATNALPTMAPWGGADKIVGINPLAVAIPAGVEAPLVLDAAFSYSSLGKIRVYEQKGFPIPPTWAFDSDGRPTTDPAAALAGLLQPIGEYKGVGLAIVIGVLSSLLSGAAYGTELGNLIEGPKPGRDGHFFLAINVGAFVDIGQFTSRVDAMVRQIRTGRRAPGVERLYAPGGLEAELEHEYRRAGIPLNDATLDGLRSVARELHMPFELPDHS